ncbi:hypothetical protein KDH_32720 [Dictyobacter sp. S3.2.2.5]|uniref:Uncharacterized protein n=1 Tax=Dictyobacter halimunensis TaxID=3026934 RepID=A0ABQ6FQ80_9CHLR|nr:hypothetical protein KDH_32720 [Dictyobacter sp. S3.2.2.5]
MKWGGCGRPTSPHMKEDGVAWLEGDMKEDGVAWLEGDMKEDGIV